MPVKKSSNGVTCRHDPVADQRHLAPVPRARLDRAANLDRKPDRLREQNRDQDKDVLETCEEGFHALKMIICEMTHLWEGGGGREDADAPPGYPFE